MATATLWVVVGRGDLSWASLSHLLQHLRGSLPIFRGGGLLRASLGAQLLPEAASGLLAELDLLCFQQMPTPRPRNRLLEQKTGRDYSFLSKTALGKSPHSLKLVKWQDV